MFTILTTSKIHEDSIFNFIYTYKITKKNSPYTIQTAEYITNHWSVLIIHRITVRVRAVGVSTARASRPAVGTSLAHHTVWIMDIL